MNLKKEQKTLIGFQANKNYLDVNKWQKINKVNSFEKLTKQLFAPKSEGTILFNCLF